MLTILLYCIGGFYLLSLIVQLTRLFVRRRQAVRSPEVRFDLSLFTDDTVENPYRFISITPWFYDETGKHFSVGFSLAGFRVYYVPTGTMEPLIREHLDGALCWQVLYDSVTLMDGTHGPVPVVWGERGMGFSPGDDLLFVSNEGVDQKVLDRFRTERAAVRGFTWKLTAGVVQVIRPDVVVEKAGNRWTIGFRDPDQRTRFLRLFFQRISEKVLRKNGIETAVVEVHSDAAERFVSRGQVSWWVTGKLDNEAVVFDAEGIRPGEATSADWALISIPFERKG